MGAPELLHALQGQGLRVWAEGDRLLVAPKARITDETRRLIREHKAELLTALSADTLSDPAAEARRQRVLAMLAERPSVRYAAITDTLAVPGSVVLTLGVRHVGTVELLIPADKWDGVLFLEMLERHAVH